MATIPNAPSISFTMPLRDHTATLQMSWISWITNDNGGLCRELTLWRFLNPGSTRFPIRLSAWLKLSIIDPLYLWRGIAGIASHRQKNWPSTIAHGQTLDAIADIGLSERLGFLDAGDDLVTAESMDGKLSQANYRQCLRSTAQAQAGSVWSYEWFPFLAKVSKIVSPEYRQRWKLNQGWNDIVYRCATQWLRRYQTGEKLEDFFQALMEKDTKPEALDYSCKRCAQLYPISELAVILLARVTLRQFHHQALFKPDNLDLGSTLHRDS